MSVLRTCRQCCGMSDFKQMLESSTPHHQRRPPQRAKDEAAIDKLEEDFQKEEEQARKRATKAAQRSYMNGISQKSIAILTKG